MIGRALVGALLVSSLASAQEVLPASSFARLPAVETPMLSPDGSRIAQIENGVSLVVRSVADLSPLAAVNTANMRARSVLWVQDDIVIVIVSDASPWAGNAHHRELLTPIRVDVRDNSARRLTRGFNFRSGPFTTNWANVIGRDPETQRIVVGSFDDDGYSLFSIDPRNVDSRLVESGSVFTRNWVLDESGKPMVRSDYDDRNNLRLVHARREQGWEIVMTHVEGIPILDTWGFDAAGNFIIGTELPDVGRFGPYVLSLETGSIERAYYVDDVHDIDEPIRDLYTNRVVGAIVRRDYPVAVWFDAELAMRQAEISRIVGSSAMVTSWSQDRQRVIARFDNGAEPPLFYFYDAPASELRAFASAYPEAHSTGVARRSAVSYPARDGVQIPAYVTMIDGLAQPAPLVVLPHDGPEARDVGGFDWLAHFLASRGYLVVQPNFRGSVGYGTAWRDAGRGGWGTGVMQHDLTDAVAAFVEEGMANPDRVCIVGRGYGGYAALAGAVFTPDLYRCAAAIAPITDLNDILSDERTNARPRSWVVEYWHRVVGGDLGVSGERLAAISPVDNADRVHAPILLIHGDEDTVVPLSQSRRMQRALARAGKDVELVELREEDHSLSNAETRLEALLALERFLAKHLN